MSLETDRQPRCSRVILSTNASEQPGKAKTKTGLIAWASLKLEVCIHVCPSLYRLGHATLPASLYHSCQAVANGLRDNCQQLLHPYRLIGRPTLSMANVLHPQNQSCRWHLATTKTSPDHMVMTRPRKTSHEDSPVNVIFSAAMETSPAGRVMSTLQTLHACRPRRQECRGE